MGLKRAGFNVIGAVEISEEARSVYELNHPEVYLWPDSIRKVAAKRILKELKFAPGELDLLAGCPPCQGFSTVRTLNGRRVVSDKRNELIFDFARLVRGLRPKAVMLENVPGLAEDIRLQHFVNNLSTLGYTVESHILNAANYAVPQRRRRIILLAGRNGPISFAREALRQRTVRDAIGSLKPAGKSRDAAHDTFERRTTKVRRLIRLIPKDGGSRMDLPLRYQLPCHKRCNGFRDIYGRMAWDAVAPTLTTGCFNPSRGRFLHPEENRAITMREAALLQTFPKAYKFPAFGKTVLADLIGNAIPPELVRRQAISVIRYLKKNHRNNGIGETR